MYELSSGQDTSNDSQDDGCGEGAGHGEGEAEASTLPPWERTRDVRYVMFTEGHAATSTSARLSADHPLVGTEEPPVISQTSSTPVCREIARATSTTSCGRRPASQFRQLEGGKPQAIAASLAFHPMRCRTTARREAKVDRSGTQRSTTALVLMYATMHD